MTQSPKLSDLTKDQLLTQMLENKAQITWQEAFKLWQHAENIDAGRVLVRAFEIHRAFEIWAKANHPDVKLCNLNSLARKCNALWLHFRRRDGRYFAISQAVGGARVLVLSKKLHPVFRKDLRQNHMTPKTPAES